MTSEAFSADPHHEQVERWGHILQRLWRPETGQFAASISHVFSFRGIDKGREFNSSEV